MVSENLEKLSALLPPGVPRRISHPFGKTYLSGRKKKEEKVLCALQQQFSRMELIEKFD